MVSGRAYKFVPILIYSKVYSTVRTSTDLLFNDILINSVLRPFGLITRIFCPCVESFLEYESV